MTTLWAVGHSTRPVEEFLEVLRSARIEVLVDIRRYPTSRRHPQFESDALKRSLHGAGIAYLYLGDDLGGWRKTSTDSPNGGLTNPSFRGYADWMAAAGFRAGVRQLLDASTTRRLAYLCAERAPTGCHRHLLSDYLVLVHGVDVRDLYDVGVEKPHRLTACVRRAGNGVTYAPAASRLESFE